MNGASAAAVLASLESAADRFVALDMRFVLLALAFQLVNLALRSLALRNVIAASYPEKRVSAWTVGGGVCGRRCIERFRSCSRGEALKIALLRLRIAGSSVPTLVSAGGLLTALDAVIGASLIGSFLGLGLPPSLPSPRLPSATVTRRTCSSPAPSPSSSPQRLCWQRDRSLVVPGRSGFTCGRAERSCGRLDATSARSCSCSSAAGPAAPASPSAFSPRSVSPPLCRWRSSWSSPAASRRSSPPRAAPGRNRCCSSTRSSKRPRRRRRSFSVGMQVGITTVNTLIGLSALMLMFRTVRPTAAVRAARRAAGARVVEYERPRCRRSQETLVPWGVLGGFPQRYRRRARCAPGFGCARLETNPERSPRWMRAGSLSGRQ